MGVTRRALSHEGSYFKFIFTTIVLTSFTSCTEVAKKEERIGLLASTLGVPPVPGYNPEAEAGGEQGLISGGGFQGPPPSYGPQGGGFQDHNKASEPYSSSGFQGGNNLNIKNPCQCVPIAHCSNYKGSLPISQPPPPPVESSYGGGDNKKEEVELLPPGYGGGGNGGGGGDTSGIGLIDIRIVNNPANGPPKVQCLDGYVFCCDSNKQKEPVVIGGGGGYDPGSGNVPPPEPKKEQNYFQGGGYSSCGVRTVLDVPGWNPEHGQAKFGAYPWMAVILGKGNNYIGAGALISAHYVLTAAHKVKNWGPGSYMKIRLGEWNAKDDDEPFKNVEIDVEHVLLHPEFNPDNLYNDVALIKLAKPIDINAFPHIKTACLPKTKKDFVGHRCWVAGFGKDSFGNGKHSYIMREVDLPVVDGHVCEKQLKGTRLGPNFLLNKHSFICAGGEEGKDACSGDGGSPLMCQSGEHGEWSVVGMVAWGIGCADYAVPGVYVNVQSFLPWIEYNIKNVNSLPPPSSGFNGAKY